MFRLAETEWVMVCDSHVLFESGAIECLQKSIKQGKFGLLDFVQGPLVYDNGGLATHWKQTTPPGLWGVWEYDSKEKLKLPFEIPMQGLGVFAMRKEAWPGFNPLFTGFGGEEGYIHELVRRKGGKTLCLPELRWRHRFRDSRFEQAPYPLRLADHVWNLLVGHRELGINAVEAIHKDFGKNLPEFDGFVQSITKCQPWNFPGERQKPLKILGMWYTNNRAPEKLLQNSLDTIWRASTLSRHNVDVYVCSWDGITDNPFYENTLVAGYREGPGHLNIVRQQKQILEVADDNYDVVCFLEHDVLYPPDYFDRVALTFMQNPEALVVSNLDYEGLCASGWQHVKERHEPLHQLSMRYSLAVNNLGRAEDDALRQGWCLLEPQGSRDNWARIPPKGIMPSIHVNHTHGRFTSHGEVVFATPGYTQIHPFWGPMIDYWPEVVEISQTVGQQKKGCSACGDKKTAGSTSEVLPQSINHWFNYSKDNPNDFHQHMDVLRDYASKCEHVTEISGWRKPALVALAEGCKGKVVSYCHAKKPEWAVMEKLIGDRFNEMVAQDLSDLQLSPGNINGTDLLFVDTKHNGPTVFTQLTRFSPFVSKYLVIHCTSTYGKDGEDNQPGVMAGIRMFLKNHREWNVVYSTRENHGLMILSRLEEDRKEAPGLLRKAANFLGAKARHIAAGRPTVTEEVFNSRLDVCLTCEERAYDVCSACGCPLDAKLSYATETCGLEKLGKEPKWLPVVS